jgi:hypothetical protein
MALLINVLFGSRPLMAIALDGRPAMDQLAWGVAIAAALGFPFLAVMQFIPALAPLRAQLAELAMRVDFAQDWERSCCFAAPFSR